MTTREAGALGLPASRVEELLRPFLLPGSALPARIFERLTIYLDLLLRWNERISLTSVRDPQEIVTRHFGESLFAGQLLPSRGSLLDFGSGAGFPGLPILLLHPGLRVTLAESQAKKASFLREAARSLGVPAQVWPRRVEDLPATSRFDTVTLRAVDNMPFAVAEAASRAENTLCVLSGSEPGWELPGGEWIVQREPMPLAWKRVVVLARRSTALQAD